MEMTGGGRISPTGGRTGHKHGPGDLIIPEDTVLTAMKSRLFPVSEYGAVGDGEADDWAALVAALDDANGSAGLVLLEPGAVYKVSAPVAPSDPIYNVTFGALTPAGPAWSAAARIVAGDPDVTPLGGVWNLSRIQNICFDADNLGGWAGKPWLSGSTLVDCTFDKWNEYGLYLNHGDVLDEMGYLNHVEHNDVRSPDEGSGVGIFQAYRMTDSWIEGNNVGSDGVNLWLEGGPCRVLFNHLDGGAPLHNIYARGFRRHAIIGNICERAVQEAFLFEHPPWESGDRIHQGMLSNNTFINGGTDSPGDYSAVRIVGLSNTEHTVGWSMQGNVFSTDPEHPDAGWKYAVHMKWAKDVSLVSNIWSDSYAEANPVLMEECGSYDVDLNGGFNGVDVI